MAESNGDGVVESGTDVGAEEGKGVEVPEREMPRISSMAAEDLDAMFFDAMKRARWARTLRGY